MWARLAPLFSDNTPLKLRLLGLAAAVIALLVAAFIALRRRMEVERVRHLAEQVLLKDEEPEAEPEAFPAVGKASVRRSADEISMTPTTVHWSNEAKWREWAGVLVANGFERVGSYLIPELTLPLDIWINSKERLTSCIVDHMKIGMWLDFITRYEDGTGVTFANKKGGLDSYPLHKVVYAGPVDAEELLQTTRAGRAKGDLRVPTPDNVIDDYIQDWRELVRWRKKRGVSVEEVGRVNRARRKG